MRQTTQKNPEVYCSLKDGELLVVEDGYTTFNDVWVWKRVLFWSHQANNPVQIFTKGEWFKDRSRFISLGKL